VSLPPRILLGLGLPVAFIAAVAATAWVIFDWPAAPWNWLVAIVLSLAALAVGGGYCAFLDKRNLVGALPFAAPVAVALIAGAMVGANQQALHERGHDVACRITSVTQRHGSQHINYEYGVNCDGGAPSTINDTVMPPEDVTVGQRVVLRYDASGAALTELAKDSTDGQVPLTIAAIAAGLLLLIGLTTTLFPRPPG